MAMRVNVVIEEVELEGDEGQPIDGLLLTCDRCGHTVEVFGTEAVSARHGAVMLREECPTRANNFYVIDWTD
jgi:hypothetical protein